jgi:acetamidase/formamidase
LSFFCTQENREITTTEYWPISLSGALLTIQPRCHCVRGDGEGCKRTGPLPKETTKIKFNVARMLCVIGFAVRLPRRGVYEAGGP